MKILVLCFLVFFLASCGQNSPSPLNQTGALGTTGAIIDEMGELPGFSGSLSEGEYIYELDKIAHYRNYDGDLTHGTDEKILFFYDPECPSCLVADTNLSAESTLAVISDIIKIDFNMAENLKNQYLIQSPHTFVLIDENGNMIKKITNVLNSQALLTLYE